MAEEWFVEIYKIRPEDEKAHFSLMRLYDQLGYSMFVEHQYLRLEKALKELELQVSPQIKRWYIQSMQKNMLS